MPVLPSRSAPASLAPPGRARVRQAGCLLLVWLAVYGASLARPPLLDDADATHAQAALAMLRTGDWVTLHVDGVRYLEKPPLPYWLTAMSLRCFGVNAFAVHLPLALTVLGLAVLGWVWGTRAFGERAGFYAALMMLTAAGTFLFTRIFIPDALLSLLLALTLYCVLRALAPGAPGARAWAYAAWLALAGAVLTKGLVALVFVVVPVAGLLLFAGRRRAWQALQPVTGALLFLLVAAPWHVLAGVRNRGGAGGHGFFWFYFVNEHVLRFLGRRVPADYNKLPALWYWSLHLVWLFPWSLLAVPVLGRTWAERDGWRATLQARRDEFATRSVVLLGGFAMLVLVFFSLSTNQEYYTFPVYLPVLLLTGAGLARLERGAQGSGHRLLLGAHVALVAIGWVTAAALAYGLWSSRHLAGGTDVSALFAHRGIGDYTLSMSHFLDLTTASFAALRLPAALACAALLLGPAASLAFRRRRRHVAATLSLALMSTVFLVAAHLALERFGHMLSSADFAAEIRGLERTGAVEPGAEVLLFGDQALGSSVPFYLGRQVMLVDGRSTSMLFGSTFPDAPPIFVTHAQLRAAWGQGARKLLFVPAERLGDVQALLGPRAVPVYRSAGKTLFTDRPLRAATMDSSPPAAEQ